MRNRILWHLCFWIVYLLLNVRLQSFDPDENFWIIMAGESLTLPAKMGLTYFVFYWIIPRFLEKDNRRLLILQLIAAFCISVLFYRWTITTIIVPTLHPELLSKMEFWSSRAFWWTGWDIFITVASAATIKLFRLYNVSQEHEQELIRQKLQSELNFLRAQTNPHFLFNTLNNLYVLAWKKSDQTPDAIMTLSKIMRFMLYDCRQPRIAVADEAKVIKDYIELEKLRYNKRLTVNYEEQIEEGSREIAPLLLLPFVENAFKHGGKGTTGEAFISIKLCLKADELNFYVENNLEEDSPRGEPEGIGLTNVKRQLELIYPLKHELIVLPENHLFKVKLTINL